MKYWVIKSYLSGKMQLHTNHSSEESRDIEIEAYLRRMNAGEIDHLEIRVWETTSKTCKSINLDENVRRTRQNGC